MARERINIAPTDGSSRFNGGILSATLAADRVLTEAEIDDYQFFAFDPGGAARNLDLPAEAASKGAFLFISNTADAAEIITVRDDAAGTICTPTQNEDAIVWCDGAAWYGGVLTAS